MCNLFSITYLPLGERAFPMNLGPHCSSRDDIVKFGMECKEIGVQYIGLCCGNCAHLTRTLAETMGNTPPGSAYSPDMSEHFLFGKESREHNKKLISVMAGDDILHPEYQAK